jgi:hypothetical protein
MARQGSASPGTATRPAAVTARAVTRGPNHHFFGYYDKCPWDRTGRYLLAMEIGFIDRQPEPGEPLTLGMVDLKDGNRYIPLDETTAWSWQQGTMLQWLGPAADREVIYNGVADGQYVSIVRDVHSGKTRTLPRPIYAVSADGRQAVSLDFDRVNRLRPGYGYMALPEKHAEIAAPADAGIYWMDLRTGTNKLIIPIEWAANHKPDERFKDAHHWFNHLQFNPSGTRFIFLHRWTAGKSWYTRLYSARPDGTDIRLHSDLGMVSHFDWRDDDTILAWATLKPKTNRFCLFDVNGGDTRILGEGVLTHDGHCSYSPDRKWVLTDSYPDRNGDQRLFLYRPAENRRIEIAAFQLPQSMRHKPWRCDLHPRWNRDGTQVCIDSTHEPTRQVYVLDVRQAMDPNS